MVQYVIVFVAVAVCVYVTVRMVLRVFSGKSTNCSLCDGCDLEKPRKCDGHGQDASCGKPPDDQPEGR